MFNRENEKNISEGSMVESESFEYENGKPNKDLDVNTEKAERRPEQGLGKSGDFSAFGAPMKVQSDAEPVGNDDITEASEENFEEALGKGNEPEVNDESEIAEESEALEDKCESTKEKSEDSTDPTDNTEKTEELVDDDESDIEYGQIRGFGCDEYDENESTGYTMAFEADDDNEDIEVSAGYGIQQKFDLVFLEPMAEEEEPESDKEDYDIGEAMSEVVEATYADDVEYETEDSLGTLEEEIKEEPAELAELAEVTEVAEFDQVTEVAEVTDESFDMKEEQGKYTEAEAPDTEDIDSGAINDIWDESEREEWQAREKFLEQCRALSIPPLKITKTEKPLKRRPPMRSTTSGYRYENAERLPFDEGTKTVENESEYRKKEKAFCKKRAKEHEEKLVEKLSKARARFWAVAVFLLISVALDCMNFVNMGGNAVINAGTLTAFSCAEIAILVIVSIISCGILRDGISCAFKGAHIPETLTAVVIFISLAYNSSVLVLEHREVMPVLMGSPAVAAVLLAALYRQKMLYRELQAFSIASAYRPYTTEVKMKDFSSAPEYTEFGGYAPCESELYKLNKIHRIDGIYETQQVRDTCCGIIRVLCFVTLCVSLIVGLAFGLIERSVLSGFFCAALVMAIASPVSVFVSMYLPRIKASKANEQDGSAIISFDENDKSFEKSVIMLDDSELYPAQMLSPKIEVCKTPDMEERLHKVASLFNRLGGTLGSLFNEAGFEDYKEVELREIEAHGIYALVEDTDVIVGSEKYLLSYGIRVNRYEGELSQESGVLYIADGGEFFCRIIMTFKPDTELCKRISELRNADTLVSLKSCNPCVDEALVFTTTALEPELLKLIKYSSGDDVCPEETDREGKIVSLNGSAGLFSAILEYKRQRRRISIGGHHAIFSCILGIIASLGLIFGGGSVLKFSPIIAVGAQALLSVISGFAVSGKAINTRTVIKKK